MEIRALTEAERQYTYTQSMQIQGQTECIGYLRGDFGTGKEFYTTWNDCCKHWKTDEFKAEFDEVINTLRTEEYGLLQNRSAMRHYVSQNAESVIEGNYCTEYGFRVDTEKHAYLFRCNPIQGDYNFYCYCYVSEWLDRHLKQAQQGIRFIDSHYTDLFRIPDGGKIVVTDQAGKKNEQICRFIDEYHTEIGGHLYHICQFAEIMERNGSTYEPVKMQTEKKERSEGNSKSENNLLLTDSFGKTWQVQLTVNTYLNNKSLFVGMTAIEDGEPEPYGNITVNLGVAVPNFCAYVDTNNMPDIESFLVENKIAEFTGLSKGSGYCEYPLYLFNPERLHELCPAGIATYEAENGINRTEKKEEKSR